MEALPTQSVLTLHQELSQALQAAVRAHAAAVAAGEDPPVLEAINAVIVSVRGALASLSPEHDVQLP